LRTCRHRMPCKRWRRSGWWSSKPADRNVKGRGGGSAQARQVLKALGIAETKPPVPADVKHRLASRSLDRTVKIWDAAVTPEVQAEQ
jgi:hypothetical protein